MVLRRLALLLLLPTGCAEVTRAETGRTSDPVSYSRDIRPILTAKCFACHGPDPEARKADLRLDQQKYAIANRDGSRAITPGKPAKSDLMQRVTSHDADLRMPPKATGKTLSVHEVALLRKWIEQGAKYDRHWAFVAPKRPALPRIRNNAWVRNGIDRFILARLERAGLRPSAQADAATLIRRVSLDLTGLQPTPEDWRVFSREAERTSFDAAYRNLVDRLLASPRYGERWARRWLDLARYADTNGYEKDRPRSIWAYRDWVIAALNGDMPFDEFTIAQIAGDMLPASKQVAKTRRHRIATGFHRNTMLNEEGGIDPLEFRFYAMVDRVATTGTTWLGLTLGCAQCHSHKYDPVTHTDFYRLMAFLNNADEPELELPDQALAAQSRENLVRARELLAKLPQKWPVPKGGETLRSRLIERRFHQWLKAERSRTVPWTPLRPVSAKANLPLLTVQPDNSVFASGDTTKSDTYELAFQPTQSGITAVLLEALPDNRLPERGPGSTYYEGTRGDFFLGEFRLFADGKRLGFSGASHSYAKNRFGRNPVSAKLAVDGDPQTGWSVHGRQGERHTAVFVLREPLAKIGKLKLQMLFGRHFASSLGRFKISVTTSKASAVARDFPIATERLLAMPDSRLSSKQRGRLFEEFLLRAPELAREARQILRLRGRPDFPTTLVMQERPANNPRPTHVHKRGEFLRPTAKVSPGIPAFLPPLSKNAPRNRLSFARWLVSGENPLTSRVTVNRHWAALFGRGIVSSVDDFGVQGDSPTHPQLLDWLAVSFQTPRVQGGMGWSLKSLHKQIVLSATYRQSSVVNVAARKVDPENTLLAWSPRPRLDAEVIRDAILRAAGLLALKMGGPGVRPPQPRGITEVTFGSPKWVASSGADRHRRSVYTFLKRTAPFAMYGTFDASSGESCTAQRDRSNTPLQALTLLNDVMFVEAARAMGALLSARTGTDALRVRLAFRRLLTRPPTGEESRLLVSFLQTQRQRFRAGELNAEKVSGVKRNAIEAASWTTLARALFALDETVTRN